MIFTSSLSIASRHASSCQDTQYSIQNSYLESRLYWCPKSDDKSPFIKEVYKAAVFAKSIVFERSVLANISFNQSLGVEIYVMVENNANYVFIEELVYDSDKKRIIHPINRLIWALKLVPIQYKTSLRSLFSDVKFDVEVEMFQEIGEQKNRGEEIQQVFVTQPKMKRIIVEKPKVLRISDQKMQQKIGVTTLNLGFGKQDSLHKAFLK